MSCLLPWMRAACALAVLACTTARADIVWRLYDGTGTSAANAGTYSVANGGVAVPESGSISFEVAPLGRVTLYTHDFEPISLPADGNAFRLQFKMRATGGLSGISGTTRLFHFGLFNRGTTPDNLFDDAGPIARWHNSNQSWETRVRLANDTNANMMGGGTSPGTAVYGTQVGAPADGVVHTLAMNVANSAGSIVLPAGNGVELLADGVYRTSRTNPYALGTTTFNLFAFFFENRSASTVTVTLSEINLVGLTVVDPNAPPTIARQPVGATVIQGQRAVLDAAAAGPQPYAYQWFRGEDPVPGATASTLVFAEARVADSGTYRLRVTNNGGSVFSDPVQLVVSAPPVSDMAVVSFFPAPGATGVNTDTPLKITYDRVPTPLRSGRVRIHDVATGNVVAEIDMATTFASPPGKPGVVLPFPALVRVNGGYGTPQNVFPITVDGNTATIHLAHGSLALGKTYAVVLEPGVIGDGPLALHAGIIGLSTWTFTTRATAPAIGQRVVVAADGSGDFSTVQGAINALPTTLSAASPVEVFIKAGTYVELVYTGRNRAGLVLRGESRAGSVIAYANNDNLNAGTAGRPVVILDADDVTLRNLTVRNTTPKGGSQAEAVRSNRARALLASCNFHSLQDTILINEGSAMLTDCLIEGDVDYFWGSAAVMVHRSEVRTLNPGYLVQSRNATGNRGFVFVECRLSKAPTLAAGSTYLARVDPGVYPGSETVFVDCTMDDHVRAEGWLLNNNPATAQLRFAEYRSRDLAGNLVATGTRMAGSLQLTDAEAAQYRDPAFVLGGWNPLAGDPYAAWRDARFDAAARLDPLATGPSGDPDRDGLPNGAEFALGRSPTRGDGGAAVEVAAHPSGIALRWNRPATAPGYRWVVESRASHGEPWSPAPGSAAALGSLDGIETWEHAIPVSPSVASQFARLRVDLP